ncbi:MAG: flagellar hook-basal body protein [Acetobacteraceae bacterium]|nr:flagellar hook-basal body protein [Acetobacteraceae bacterium]
MFRGLYTAALGMIGQLWRTEVAANNLANASTPGFKRDVPVVGAFPGMLLRRLNDAGGVVGLGAGPAPAVGELGMGARVEEVAVDHTPGPVSATGAPWDIALLGPGFFVVQTPQGLAYTRRGRFELAPGGTLATSQGYPVMGRDGPLRVGPGRVQVAEDGTVLLEDEPVDRLLVVDFPAPAYLARRDGALFGATPEAGAPAPVEQVRVRQGSLEGANVSLVEEMVGLISAFRSYEASQKAVQALDSALGRAVNDVGR